MLARSIDKIEFRWTATKVAFIAFGVIAVIAVVPSGCSQLAPKHNIPARPDFIQAGVKAGDSIEVTTKDGKLRKIVVKDISTDAIVGTTETIRFNEIQSIVKRSWTEPEHPCGGGLPVGCSIPEVILLLSDDYEQQAEKFHPACVTHDFCYRHGLATYGATREECDAIIYDEMKKTCEGAGGLDVLDLKGFGICQLAANQTYKAVRRYGEKHFQTTTSTYCEYRVDP